MKKVSTFLGIIIIVVVAIVIFGGVFAWQYYIGISNSKFLISNENLNPQTLNIQNETANTDFAQNKTAEPAPDEAKGPAQSKTVEWKTYEDGSYGYSIQYPENWYLEKNSNANGIVYNLIFSNYLKEEVESNPPEDLYIFGLNVYDIDPQTTYNDILEGYRPYNYTAEQNVEIDRLKSIKLTKKTNEYLIKSLETFESTNTYIFAKKGSTLFIFLYSYENPYSGEAVGQDKIDTTEEIISTFKFTN